ncbi:nuclear transport factor 2 family protein [Aquimarina mytili]|uniref:Nuclear transport factor 2 family protein n=1 Tax=Aquimarina mytili TaxID=874423 RepID=A0A936ZU96_9FLAO|nr:nuclear transport factor 2 family protein [Aquimarina mytili]MBL0684427.1 nuclear transport factor 2 family protein [Aquimarina mytili]
MTKHNSIRVVSLIFVSLFTITSIVAQHTEENTLWKKIQEFNLAFKQGNVEILSAMITENYMHTNSTSKPIDKNTWISYLSKRKKEIESGNLVVHSYEMKEREMQLYDDMAIVSAKISTSSTSNGNRTQNEYRVTNIWIKEENTWKRAGFHDGKIK